MELVTPGIGLMFWTVVIFTLLLILLKKFAWGPILDSVDNRNKNIENALVDFKDRIKISLVPNITNICYGRGVGYKIEEIVLSKEVQEISATKIREKMRKEGKLK